MSDPLQDAIAKWAEDALRQRTTAEQARTELSELASSGVSVRYNDPERLIGVFPGKSGSGSARGWRRYLHVVLVTHERAAERERVGLSGAPTGMWEWMLILAPDKARCASAFLDRGAERSRMLAVKSAVESWCEEQQQPSPAALRLTGEKLLGNRTSI